MSKRKTKIEMIRDENLHMAKVAEQAERFDDMSMFMENLAMTLSDMDQLKTKERNMLALAFKNIICSRRSALRTVSSIVHEEERNPEAKYLKATRDYRDKIDIELQELCRRVLKIVDERLIPSARDNDSKVFYLKMKGDYHRYLAEFSSGNYRDEAIHDARCAYSGAQALAQERLPPWDPNRLGVALNFSVFYYEILNSPEDACSLAKKALSQAAQVLHAIEEDQYRDSTLIMQLLTDNLSLWAAEIEDEVPEEATGEVEHEE